MPYEVSGLLVVRVARPRPARRGWSAHKRKWCSEYLVDPARRAVFAPELFVPPRGFSTLDASAEGHPVLDHYGFLTVPIDWGIARAKDATEKGDLEWLKGLALAGLDAGRGATPKRPVTLCLDGVGTQAEAAILENRMRDEYKLQVAHV